MITTMSIANKQYFHSLQKNRGYIVAMEKLTLGCKWMTTLDVMEDVG